MPNPITLKPLKKIHMVQTFEWISDLKFRKEFLVRGQVSWEKHVDYFENLLKDINQKVYSISLGDHHIGNCGFKHINHKQKSAELWLYIGDSNQRGFGTGGNALKILLNKATLNNDLNNIFVHVEESNEVAKKLYENNGFIEEGECSKEWQARDEKMLRMSRKC